MGACIQLSKYTDAKILHRQESGDFTKEKLTMEQTVTPHLPLPPPPATMSLPSTWHTNPSTHPLI